MLTIAAAAASLSLLMACGPSTKPAPNPMQNTASSDPVPADPVPTLLAKLDSLAFAVNVDCVRMAAGIDQWISESGAAYGDLATQIAETERSADEADELEDNILERLEGILDRVDECLDTESVDPAFARLSKVLGR